MWRLVDDEPYTVLKLVINHYLYEISAVNRGCLFPRYCAEEADARGNVNSTRQNLQMEYVTRLAKMVKGGYDTPSQSMAIYNLNAIESLLGRKRGNNIATRAHTQNLKLTIDRALDTHG